MYKITVRVHNIKSMIEYRIAFNVYIFSSISDEYSGMLISVCATLIVICCIFNLFLSKTMKI